jgi:2-hydroxychromene-2-carboxylate isomerase
MPIPVDYYLSLNSPWTYLGSALFAEIARRNNVTVNVKPGFRYQNVRRSGAPTG